MVDKPTFSETVWLVDKGLLHLGILYEDGTAETNCTAESKLPRFKAKQRNPTTYQNVKLCNRCLSYEVEVC